MENLKKGKHPARFAFFLDDEERMRRAITMNIRHAGFNRDAFYEKFGTYPEDQFPAEFQVLQEDGFIVRNNNTLCLTEKGFKRADTISKLFFSDRVLEMQKKYVYE